MDKDVTILMISIASDLHLTGACPDLLGEVVDRLTFPNLERIW